MGLKTSLVPQLDFLLPSLIKRHHRPTRLTGKHNTEALASLRARGLTGITAAELSKERDWLENTAGPCLVELRWLGLARKTDARRGGKSVYIAIAEDT